MGKYALGNPKNNWSDRFWDVKPGDHVLVHWQSNEEDEVARTTERVAVYEVLEKKVVYTCSEGVEWKLRDVRTGEEMASSFHARGIANLNDRWDNHRAYSRKLKAGELERFLAGEVLEAPPQKAFDPRVDYKHQFDTQGGKYPKPAKPRRFVDPEAGAKYRMMNHREGEYRYDVIVQGIELWGVGNPKAVAYKRVGSDVVERRTVDYFAFNFSLMRD